MSAEFVIGKRLQLSIHVEQRDTESMSIRQRIFRGAFGRNGESLENRSSEPAAVSSTVTPLDIQPAQSGPDPSRADSGRHPATERQLNYIRILGGDPSSVRSKKEASNLIDRLLLVRRKWPLDSEQLAQRGAQAAAASDGEWKTAHHSLLADLRLDLQEYVDLRLGNLRAKLSDPLGLGGSSQFQGPAELVRRAEAELQQLELCRKWQQPLSNLELLGECSDTLVQRPNNENTAAKPSPRDDTSRVHWTRWLGLVAAGAVCVTIESGLNIALLMGGLPGGALQAFMLALLVSLINVGGLGIGAGLLMSEVRRRIKPDLYRVAWAVWIPLAVAFNFVVGRHREAYARVLDLIRENPTALVPDHRVLLAEISFNPLTWELEALLFALLGTSLCAFGFWKGFTFMRGIGVNSVSDGQAGASDIVPGTEAPYQRQLFDAFASLPQRYRSCLTSDLRGEVANWYKALDRERRDVTTLLEMMKEGQYRQACVDRLEHAFIVEHNGSYPDKIGSENVQAHRLEKYPEPLTVTASDPQVLEEAGRIILEWSEAGHAAFDNRIASANDEIVKIWTNYRPLVLGKPGRLVVEDGELASPVTQRS